MTDYPDPFWNPADFDFADSLNLDIFLNSVRVQKQEIGLPVVYGAQQAMSAVGSLPWIPDPVGRHWKHRDSVLFCGSSYAGIFRPFSTRGRTTGRVVPVQDYAEMDSLRSLQTLFLTQIMARNGYSPADRYYGPIEQLWPLSQMLLVSRCFTYVAPATSSAPSRAVARSIVPMGKSRRNAPTYFHGTSNRKLPPIGSGAGSRVAPPFAWWPWARSPSMVCFDSFNAGAWKFIWDN